MNRDVSRESGAIYYTSNLRVGPALRHFRRSSFTFMDDQSSCGDGGAGYGVKLGVTRQREREKSEL